MTMRAAATMVAGLAVALGGSVLVAGPAAADLSGACSGVSGTIEETGVLIDPAASDGPFEVPLEGTVVWTGTVGDGSETDPRTTDGAIAVIAPPIVDELLGGLLEFRDWGDDDAVSTTEGGTDTYELPDITPRDAELVVTGFHDDPVGGCDGSVTIIVEGSPMDSPLAIGALAGTALTGAGVVASGFARRPR